jgi:hypothetical protein
LSRAPRDAAAPFICTRAGSTSSGIRVEPDGELSGRRGRDRDQCRGLRISSQGIRHWLPGEAGEGFAAKARDISEVLIDAELPLGELRATVAYHDACHLAHGQKVRSQPRELLRRIPG